MVTDHRMAFSISTQQTVLWDQIKYSGSPTEFSWVLPVRAGAVVELSHDEWFAALDAMTGPVIAAPVSSCNSGGGGTGCGASSKAAGFADRGADAVQVVSQSVIGPYETVTLRSSDAHALESWLASNGYALPDSVRPTIAAYVAAGFDFIALRLRPGQGVQAMQPVRVVTRGADATLPLRMVAAGVGAEVGITLYVIGEGRYEAKSPFFNAVTNEAQLVWLHNEGRSNYQELSQRIMAQDRARTWLTEFSEATSAVASQRSGAPACGTVYYGTPSLADVYLGQCRCKASTACATATAPGPTLTGTGDTGAGPDTSEAGADAASEAGAIDVTDADDGPSLGPDSPDETGLADSALSAPVAACSADPCTGFDDLDVALVGLHTSDVWVTRLRAILPVDALFDGDLQLQAVTPQTPVSNFHSAMRYDDPSYDPCPSSRGCSTTATAPSPVERWLVVGALGFLGLALSRRRGRASRG